MHTRQLAGTRTGVSSHSSSVLRRSPLLRCNPSIPHSASSLPHLHESASWYPFSVEKAPWCRSSSLLQTRVHASKLQSHPSTVVYHVAASQSPMSAVPQLDNTSSSSSTSSGPGDGPPRRDNDEYYANFGEAVKTLREDLPLLFSKDLQWHIYREDITFRYVTPMPCTFEQSSANKLRNSVV